MKVFCLEEVTDEEIGQLCNYSRALYTTTNFDDEGERELEKLGSREVAPCQSWGCPSNFPLLKHNLMLHSWTQTVSPFGSSRSLVIPLPNLLE
jgi:hypothetical protein